jgi:pimeloyl-ACP methyl ester carboxylesterase
MYSFPPQSIVREHTLDAIVVVPGAMGSALNDEQRGLIWGFTNPKTYLTLWGPEAGMALLALTPAELDAIAEGTYDPKTARVKPAGLIRFSAFAPLTGGFEPYTSLVRALKDAAAHPDAVLTFAYDWRLPVRLNSQVLAKAMRQHLQQWRAHPEHAAARRYHPEQRDAGIILVAHSMGGLVARGLADTTIENGFENVRQVITLGTPFLGSVAAAVMLERGEGAPIALPRNRLRDVARTMPGLYDLLPRNRCVLTRQDHLDEVVALTTQDVVAIGGDPHLAAASQSYFETAQATTLPGHRIVEGIVQPTWQSLQIRAGTVDPAYVSYHRYADDTLMRDEIGRAQPFDDQGDGTVWRYAARPEGSLEKPVPIAQQHGALASSGETIKTVVGLVTDQGLGVRLGGGDLGLQLPDMAVIGSPFTVMVTGEADPSRVECRVVDLSTNECVRRPLLRSDGETKLADTLSLSEEGLYRVEIKGESGDPVTRILMVTSAER